MSLVAFADSISYIFLGHLSDTFVYFKGLHFGIALQDGYRSL